MYRVHEAPHDHYRYTEFALVAMLQGVSFSHIEVTPLGDELDVVADIAGKALTHVKGVGPGLARSAQRLAFHAGRSRRTTRRSPSPLGYFFMHASMRSLRDRAVDTTPFVLSLVDRFKGPRS